MFVSSPHTPVDFDLVATDDGCLRGSSGTQQLYFCPVSQRPDPDGTTPCQVLVGRLKQRSVPPNFTEIRPFEGRLDELAIYDRPLTVEEIRRHAALRAAAGG